MRDLKNMFVCVCVRMCVISFMKPLLKKFKKQKNLCRQFFSLMGRFCLIQSCVYCLKFCFSKVKVYKKKIKKFTFQQQGKTQCRITTLGKIGQCVLFYNYYIEFKCRAIFCGANIKETSMTSSNQGGVKTFLSDKPIS